MKTRIFLLVYYWLILLFLWLNIAWLEKFTLGRLLTSDNFSTLMVIFKPVAQANLFKALLARHSINRSKLSIAFSCHALFIWFILRLLWYTLATARMLVPYYIWVLLSLHFDSLLANWAYYYKNAIIVTRERALVVICTRMIGAKNFFATIALKR